MKWLLDDLRPMKPMPETQTTAWSCVSQGFSEQKLLVLHELCLRSLNLLRIELWQVISSALSLQTDR